MAECLRFDGKIMSGSVSEEAGEWFISIACEVSLPMKESPNFTIGVDRGLTKTLATNIPEKPFFDSPRPYLKFQRKLAIAQRKLSKLQENAKSRKVKLSDSKNYQKQKLKVAKLHQKISNIRSNFNHNATTEIVKHGNLIKLEKLQISGMIKNNHLSKHIADSSWGEISRQLQYKTERTGGKVEFVNPAYTSQTCSNCGHCNSENRHGEKFLCLECEFSLHSDINAAIVISRSSTVVPTVKVRKNKRTVEETVSKKSLRSSKVQGDANHVQTS
jgi:putative transposase